MSLFGGPTAAAVPEAAPAAPAATVPASASPLPGTAPKETTPEADGGPRKVTSTVTGNHPYYFDPRGDLILEVGPNNASYLVCSRSISRASPVFDKMLFGGFAESKPEADGEWRIQLPEDDPAAMRLLLNIIHGRFADVIAPATEKLLFDVTVLTDKYSLTHILRPWAQG